MEDPRKKLREEKLSLMPYWKINMLSTKDRELALKLKGERPEKSNGIYEMIYGIPEKREQSLDPWKELSKETKDCPF